jgi:hypothetical protein
MPEHLGKGRMNQILTQHANKRSMMNAKQKKDSPKPKKDRQEFSMKMSKKKKEKRMNDDSMMSPSDFGVNLS